MAIFFFTPPSPDDGTVGRGIEGSSVTLEVRLAQSGHGNFWNGTAGGTGADIFAVTAAMFTGLKHSGTAHRPNIEK